MRKLKLLRYDLLAASLILASALAELSMREAFYRISAEAPRILGVLIVWLALVLASAWVRIRRRARRRVSHGPEFQVDRAWFGPALVGISVAVWAQVVLGPWLSNALAATLVPELGPLLVLFVLIFTLIGAGAKLPPSAWSVLRRALCVVGAIFVLSQPVLAHWRAHDILWPVPDTAEPPSPRSPETQIFVLLDELNDKAAGPIMAAMSNSVRAVHHLALIPVADGTLKVVPAMFARKPFPDSKPCSPTTICSGNQVLDFSRIHASRPDIDVVGFYLPYCAIQGLRSCHVEKPATPIFSLERWGCAFLRRSEALARVAGEVMHRYCGELGGKVWADLSIEVERRIWQAPVWHDGGVLFVHMPLPHPSSRDPANGLAAHYASNLDAAAQLIGRIAATLGQDPSRSFSLVVFSDHPLRPATWCESAQQCLDDESLADDRVPLLVTGDLPATFGRLRSNQDVFDLLRSR
jgi:hypothetical protein